MFEALPAARRGALALFGPTNCPLKRRTKETGAVICRRSRKFPMSFDVEGKLMFLLSIFVANKPALGKAMLTECSPRRPKRVADDDQLNGHERAHLLAETARKS